MVVAWEAVASSLAVTVPASVRTSLLLAAIFAEVSMMLERLSVATMVVSRLLA